MNAEYEIDLEDVNDDLIQRAMNRDDPDFEAEVSEEATTNAEAKLLQRIVEQDLRPPLPHDTPNSLQGLFSDMWHADPNCRPHFREIVAFWKANTAQILQQPGSDSSADDEDDE